MLALATALFATAPGCGFQLRQVQLSQFYEVVNVTGDVRPETRAIIERSLREAGVATDVTDADAVLRLSEETIEQRATLFGDDGRATEYALTMTIKGLLEEGNDSASHQLQTFSVAGHYGVNIEVPLASVAERETLESELRRNIARQLTRYLLAVARSAECTNNPKDLACAD